MAKGYQKDQERKNKVSLLGKSLIRRSNKCFELCEVSGTSLSVFEVEPVPQVPEVDRAIIICEDCKQVLEGQARDDNALRFLESVIWSEVPAVQVTAFRLCRRLAQKKVSWAQELMDTVYLSEQAQVWLERD